MFVHAVVGGGGGGDDGHRHHLPLSLLLSVPVACCLESQHMRQARDQDAGTHLCDLDHSHIRQGIPMQFHRLVLNVSQIAWMWGESACVSTRDQDVGTHLCNLDHPHILQSIPTKLLAMQMAINPQIAHTWYLSVSLLYVVVYVRHYTCKSITTQCCITAGIVVLVGGCLAKLILPDKSLKLLCNNHPPLHSYPVEGISLTSVKSIGTPPIWNVDRLYGRQCDSMFMQMNLCSVEHIHQPSAHMQKEKKVPLGCVSKGRVGLG